MNAPPWTWNSVRRGSTWRGVTTWTGKPAGSSSVTTENRRSKPGTSRVGRLRSSPCCHCSTRARSVGSSTRSRERRTRGTAYASSWWRRLGMARPYCADPGRGSCHNRGPAGVSMADDHRHQEETCPAPARSGSRRPRSRGAYGAAIRVVLPPHLRGGPRQPLRPVAPPQGPPGDPRLRAEGGEVRRPRPAPQVLRAARQRRRHRLLVVPRLRLLPGPPGRPRRAEGPRGAPLARVGRVHHPRARRHGVRRGRRRPPRRP